MDLMAKGGGEAVAMNVLEALQEDHDVTLVTLTDPDIEGLNDYFDTAVGDLSVRRAGHLAPWLHETYGLKYYVLQNALLSRYARRHADEFDLLVSTINELGLEANSVQYVHFPFDWTVSLDNREEVFHPTVEDDSLYERLCTAIAGVDREDVQANVLLANSRWTASVVEDAYGTRPRVVHPPVDTREFDPRPWDDRENGFVALGRIERSKRIVEMIEVVDAVRERGHDVHFHVVGPTVDEEYRTEVEEKSADREYVELEGELPRDELVELVSPVGTSGGTGPSKRWDDCTMPNRRATDAAETSTESRAGPTNRRGVTQRLDRREPCHRPLSRRADADRRRSPPKARVGGARGTSTGAKRSAQSAEEAREARGRCGDRASETERRARDFGEISDASGETASDVARGVACGCGAGLKAAGASLGFVATLTATATASVREPSNERCVRSTGPPPVSPKRAGRGAGGN